MNKLKARLSAVVVMTFFALVSVSTRASTAVVMTGARDPKVSNVRAYQDLSRQVVITFDLSFEGISSRNGWPLDNDVKVSVSAGGQCVEAKSFSGKVKGVSLGRNKTIVWNVVKDLPMQNVADARIEVWVEYNALVGFDICDPHSGPGYRELRMTPKALSSAFALNTMNGKFAIADVRSDYTHGKYGVSSSAQTFLSGVACPIKFTVDMLNDDFEIDYVLVNGYPCDYPEFEFDVGSLSAGGKMNVVAVGKNGIKSDAFAVNLDVASVPPLMMGLSPTVDFGSSEVSYSGLIDGLHFFDLIKYDFSCLGQKIPFKMAPTLKTVAEFRSRSGVFTSGADVGVAGEAGAKLVKKIKKQSLGVIGGVDWDMTVTGSTNLKWSRSRAAWEKSKESIGVKGSIDACTPNLSPIPGTIVKAGLAGTLAITDAKYEQGENTYRVEFGGDPLLDAYLKGGVGLDGILDGGLKVDGGLVLQGGCPPRNGNYIDTLGLLLGLSAYWNALFVGGEHELVTVHEYFRGGPKSLRMMANGIPEDETRRVARQASAFALEAEFRSIGISLASVGDQDFLCLRSSTDGLDGKLQFGSVQDGTVGAWTCPWNDGTPDVSPSMATLADGTIIAVWGNSRCAISSGATVANVQSNMEIAVGLRNPATGEWTCKNLTDDLCYDHAPCIRTSSSGCSVFWLRTEVSLEGADFVCPAEVMRATLKDGSWEVVSAVRSAKPIRNYDARLGDDGSSEVISCAGSVMDSLMTVSVTDGKGASLLGEKAAEVAPKFVGGPSGARLAWVEDGKLCMSADLSLSSPEVVDIGGADAPASFKVVRDAGNIALLWVDTERFDPAHARHVRALAFDVQGHCWGMPTRLTHTPDDETAYAATFDAEGCIRLACMCSPLSADGSSIVASERRPVVTRSPDVCDVIVEKIEFDDEYPQLGEDVVVITTLRNRGRRGTTGSVPVEIGTGELGWGDDMTREEVRLAGGETVVLTNVLSIVYDCQAYAKINPDEVQEFANVNRGERGELQVDFTKSCLTMDWVEAEARTRTICGLTACFHNYGSEPSRSLKVVFHRDTETGPVVGEELFEGIPAGASDNGYIDWDMSGEKFFGPFVKVFAVLESADGNQVADEIGNKSSSVEIATPLDSDGDGLFDGEEILLGLNPQSIDSNGDGLPDYESVSGGGEAADAPDKPDPGPVEPPVEPEPVEPDPVKPDPVKPEPVEPVSTPTLFATISPSPLVSEGAAYKGATYNGFLGDEALGGTFTLVVKKPKKGQTTAVATLTKVNPATGKKVKISGTVDVNTGLGAEGLAGLQLNAKSVGGTLGGLAVQGVVDAAKAKDQDALKVMNAFNKQIYGLVFADAAGEMAYLTAAFSTKGKVKVAGTYCGAKVSGSTVMSVGDRCAVPFVWSKKGVTVTFVLWFDKDKRTLDDVTGLGAGATLVDKGLAGGSAATYAGFALDEAAVRASVPDAIEENFLPIDVVFNGKKFDAGKAAKVSYKKGERSVDTTKGDNVTGLKLTYSKGVIKGSFTVYAILPADKLVKNKFTVAGIMVDGAIHAVGTNKNLKPIPVEVRK